MTKTTERHQALLHMLNDGQLDFAVVEGYFAALSIHQLSQRTGVEMPISRCAYEVLYEGKQVKNVVTELMTRAKKDELLETVRP